MRDEFERLIQLSDKSADLNTTEDGEYFGAKIQGQWQGYQMRQPEVDKLIEKIFTLQEVTFPYREKEAYVVMIAAPTPPAQSSGERFVRKPDGSIVFQAHKDSAAFAEHQARKQTPPAQDEPVAYKITTTDGRSFQFMIVGHPMEKEFLDEAIKLGMPIIPLYTRPDNLRKAAEELVIQWDANISGIRDRVEDIRAALRENYGIKAETQ